MVLQTSPLKQALYYLPPELKGMPGPRMLLLRQARKTVIALEISPCGQYLYYLLLTPGT